MAFRTRSGHEIDDALALEAFGTLASEQIDTLRPFGQERDIRPGQYLYQAGDEVHDFWVVLDGQVNFIDPMTQLGTIASRDPGHSLERLATSLGNGLCCRAA